MLSDHVSARHEQPAAARLPGVGGDRPAKAPPGSGFRPPHAAEHLLLMQRTAGNAAVEALLGGARHHGGREAVTAARPSVQRFDTPEHRQIGQASAWGDSKSDIDLGGGDKLSYAEIIALGDYFGSFQDIHDLAGTPDGQAKLRWTRWFAFREGDEPPLGEEVKKGIRDRYYKLAAGNVSHFSAGGDALATYRQNHGSALKLAFRSGATLLDEKWGEARGTEAFGQHFLTDMFSAGHVRTPRAEIKSWYDQNHPGSVDAFVRFMADNLSKRLQNLSLLRHAPIANGPLEFGSADDLQKFRDEHKDDPLKAELAIVLAEAAIDTFIAEKIRDLGGGAMDSFSIGDVVSLAFHDQDSAGLAVVSDVGPDGKEVPGGYQWTAYGDKNLNVEGAGTTLQMSVAAVNVSLSELDAARDLGRQYSRGGRQVPNDELDRLETTLPALAPPFQAERYVPRENKDVGNVDLEWKWGSLNLAMCNAIVAAVHNDIIPQLRGRAPTEPMVFSPYHVHVDQAFQGFCDYFDLSPLAVLARVMGGPAMAG
jgi:hypothetical protein